MFPLLSFKAKSLNLIDLLVLKIIHRKQSVEYQINMNIPILVNYNSEKILVMLKAKLIKLNLKRNLVS